ncbi:hypothetical protein [Paludisphaera mucosa]|uniref:Lipoprotein n=1 Tax=Paludisphaera mucosa TaxID=3030827 RepID=A0ABT6FEV1_9BACT|nr:hypothetical protein [Paludisphaera mucosa]MDG3006105.1 hypothetical protein [Paludisphaera mucosa]
MRVLSMCFVLAALAAAPGCGDGPTTQAAAPRDEKSFGQAGSQHALGGDPKAVASRLKKAAAASSIPANGRLPGR